MPLLLAWGGVGCLWGEAGVVVVVVIVIFGYFVVIFIVPLGDGHAGRFGGGSVVSGGDDTCFVGQHEANGTFT